MKINRINLFAFLAFFLIILDLLIGFNLNQFYIRATLAFLFITIVPGLLIMLIMKIREVGFWEYLVYTVGLSISFVMFAGLAVNWILPWLNVTHKPLSLWPILISFNIFLLIMGCFAFRRNKELHLEPKFLKLDLINNIFFIIPMFFPVMAILGAFILNNNGPNTLTMTMLGCIATYALAIIIFRKKLNENIYPWALWLIGLSLLLMYSMRSWYFMGSDIIGEYNFFIRANENGIWDVNVGKHAYNTVLSLTILPVIFQKLISIEELLIFKVIMQIVFSIIGIIAFNIIKNKFNSTISFLSTFFFMSQVGFIMDMPSHIRQEIAFIFFGLILMFLINDYKKSLKDNLIFIIFAFSLIVSHYSTGYLAIFIFIISFSAQKIYKKFDKSFEVDLRLTTIIIILIFGFVWYSQVTFTSGNLSNVLKDSVSNLKNMFSEDVYAYGQSIYQLKTKGQEVKPNELINNYLASMNYSEQEVNESSTRSNRVLYYPNEITKTKLPSYLTGPVSTAIELIKRLPFAFMVFGLGYHFLKKRNVKERDNFMLHSISFIAIFLAILVIPFLTIAYGTFRAYQQVLFLLSPYAIMGLISMISFINKAKRFAIIITTSFVILYFLIFTGFINEVIGGSTPFEGLNNQGQAYETYYVTKGEIMAIEWLKDGRPNNIVASVHENSKLLTFGGLYYHSNFLFLNLKNKKYDIYLGKTETTKNKGFLIIQGTIIGYRIPAKIFEKNKPYNNGEGQILR